MNAALFLLPGLVLPWLGRIVPRRGTLFTRWALGLLHLVIVACWSAWAYWFALTDDPHQAERYGRFALLLAVGLFYAELVLLFPRARAAPDRAPDAAHAEDEEPPTLAGGETGAPLEEPLSADAQELLARILSCEARTVDEVMTPRAEILAAPGTTTVEAALEALRSTGRSRLVVIEGSVDRILGIAHAKDLVPLLVEGQGAEPIRLHLRRWLRVPAGESLSALLEDFRANRVHLGIVGDQLGRTLGLITLHDVSNFLAGPATVREARVSTSAESGP